MLSHDNPAPFRNDPHFMELIDPVIRHPAYERLRLFRHHHGSTFDHSIDVAWVSYGLGIRLNLRLPELVKGSLLHDFFLYDHRDREVALKHHFYSHPKRSYENAVKYFGPLTDRESDIILLHMWPVAPHLPSFAETFLVAAVDKYLALGEYLEAAGSRYAARFEQD